jgi:hypothetical protein
MKSSPKHDRDEFFSQHKNSPENKERFIQNDIRDIKVGKSRAVTNHSTRFNSYNKRLEVREQSLKAGIAQNKITKRKRLMTGRPNRPKSKFFLNSTHLATHNEVLMKNQKSKNFDAGSSNGRIRSNITTMSGMGVQSNSNGENVHNNKSMNKTQLIDPIPDTRPKITTDDEEFNLSANIEFKEVKRDDPKRGNTLN